MTFFFVGFIRGDLFRGENVTVTSIWQGINLEGAAGLSLKSTVAT